MSTSDGYALSMGLVEVSAVATLVGGPVAEKLALGEKAAAGLPWASMSAFGIIHVIKVCLSAALPDWGREVLGLRNTEVDAAVGACAVVDYRQKPRRADLGDACAIRMPHNYKQPAGQLLPFQKTVAPQTSREPTITVFYTLDRTATLILNTVTKSRLGPSLLIHEYAPDFQGPPSRFKDVIDGEIPEFRDNIVLIASIGKVAEMVVLWYMGGSILWWATGIGWAVALQGAILIIMLGISRDHLTRPRTDWLVGTLPSHAVQGGDGTIVLGLPENVRRHNIWRGVWAFTALANLASLLGVFLSLRTQPPHIAYAWIIFQAGWLLSRSVVFRLLEGASACQGILRAKPWNEASPTSRQHAFELLLGLSRHQITLHPRGIRAYQHDTLTTSRIVSLFASARWILASTTDLPTPSLQSKDERVTVLDVVGDTVLRSIIWARAPALSSTELYDTALVFLKIDEVVQAVPSVRVYSCNCVQPPGRGNTHPDDCILIEWVIFIPNQKGWVHLHGSLTKGTMPVERFDDLELHQRLERAEMWNISIRSIEELKSILALSRAAGESLRDLVKGL